MKKADIVTSILLVPVDYLMLIAAGLTSYSLRYQGFITRYRPVFFDYPINEYLPLLLLLSVFGVIVFALSGSYKITSRAKSTEILSKVFLGVSTTLLFIIVIIFLQRELFSSRFVIILAWALAIIYVWAARLIVFKLKSVFLQKGYALHNVIILGNNKAGVDISNYFSTHKNLGYIVRKTYLAFNDQSQAEIKSLLDQHLVDEVIDVRKNVDKTEQLRIINFCNESNILFSYLAHIYQSKIINFEVDSIAGYPIIQIHKSPLSGWGRILKRTFDIVIASLALIILSPLFAVIALLIKLDSQGKALVTLKRVGRGGKPFQLYKFRSMIKDAHQLKSAMMDLNERYDGPLFKIKDDPRITRVGKILRKTSLDELPQLWNVIIGNMSLIGPRPHEPEEIQQYEEETRTLLGVKPGITGLAQVSGRANLLFSEEVALDIYYIENWSSKLDLRILFKTIFVVFKFKDAS